MPVARSNHPCPLLSPPADDKLTAVRSVFTRTNATTLAMEVIALRDIEAGEEILNSYLDASEELTSAERREKVKDEWNFTCTCPICAGEGVKESDRRRRQITKARAAIEAAGRSAAGVLPHVKTLLRLYEEEQMIMPRPENYWLAAVVANALGLEEQAVGFAGMARKYWAIMFGEDSSLVKDALALELDPAGHPSRPKDD
jgi:hypothetical protein